VLIFQKIIAENKLCDKHSLVHRDNLHK